MNTFTEIATLFPLFAEAVRMGVVKPENPNYRGPGFQYNMALAMLCYGIAKSETMTHAKPEGDEHFMFMAWAAGLAHTNHLKLGNAMPTMMIDSFMDALGGYMTKNDVEEVRRATVYANWCNTHNRDVSDTELEVVVKDGLRLTNILCVNAVWWGAEFNTDIYHFTEMMKCRLREAQAWIRTSRGKMLFDLYAPALWADLVQYDGELNTLGVSPKIN